MDYAALLAMAEAAINDGRDPAGINAIIKRETGLEDIHALRQAANKVQQHEARAAAGRETPVTPGRLARAAAQGLMFGFAPEYLSLLERTSGRMTPEQAAEFQASEESEYERFRGAHPLASFGAEIAGGAAFPLGVAARATRAVGGSLLRGLTTGAAIGALSGAGHAEPGTRLAGAAQGGVLGGLFGLPLGLVSGITANLAPPQAAARRIERAISAGGGAARAEQAAREATRLGYGRIMPTGALTPQLTVETELAAARAPGTFAGREVGIARRRAGAEERLGRAVSAITGARAVGLKALKTAREKRVGPLYRALDAGENRFYRTSETGERIVDDERLTQLLSRPKVRQEYKRAIETGLIGGDLIEQPSFSALKELQEHLGDAADQAFSAGSGARGTALRRAASELDDLLEEMFPDYRAVQVAYREASRPINIIEMARLETAGAGRAAGALQRGSRELRRNLMRQFGSGDRYREFMRRVAEEDRLARFHQEVFKGAPTARRILGDEPMGAEEVIEAGTRAAAVSPLWAGGRLLGSLGRRAVRESTARAEAPYLFTPASDFEALMRALRRTRRPGAVQTAGQFVLPGIIGQLGGMTQP